MEEKDLRIGNYYNNSQDINYIKTGSDIDYAAVYGRPIPLTEEWLVKFGFEISGVTGKKGKYIVWLYDNKEYCFLIHNEKDSLDNNDLRVFSTPLANIKHVHQLQNLYHALTGEEL